ncbi:amidohydrolase [Vibrio tubiashii]|uniref:amidohydrolase n=1 Tax=Vibrio tubiashii TaxID=29498 RepID=UPI001EFDFAC2|nr:amidohydrolase [Vibrio tubiashii]MCG9581905.1 amidohydrolase [Vibrio tubiashii]MCG9615496.1 amidohydrolase [Vibrio tubiashii]MCG9687507.1 amidohydrolase [Vibrio tubiashii]
MLGSNKLVKSVLSCLSLTLAIVSTDSIAEMVSADKVFTNGKIYTVNSAQPWSESVAINNGKIIYVGDSKLVTKYVGQMTKVIDLEGKMLLPGFIDNHIHPLAGSLIASGTRLETDSKEELIARIKKHLQENPKQDPVISYGWRLNVFPDSGPTKEELDAIESDRAVYLWAVDGHSAWVNSKALEVAGVTRDTPDTQPPFSYFQRDENGDPTGWIVEVPAQLQVLGKLTDINTAYVEAGFRNWAEKFSQAGITTVFDAGVQGVTIDEGLSLYQQLEKEGKLGFKTWTSYYWNDPNVDPIPELKRVHKEYNSDLVKVLRLKVNVDGGDDKHNAVFITPYSDREDGWKGEPIIPAETLTKVVTEADAAGFDTYCHCFGDGATRMYLDAVEAATKQNPTRDRRHTASHVNFIHPDDLPRFKALNVVADFQTNWAAKDPLLQTITIRRVGKDRLDSTINPRSVLEHGGRVAISSDWPVAGWSATHEPLVTIQVAVTRQFVNPPRKPPLGGEKLRLTLDEAIYAHTLGAAYSLGQEENVGSIEVGKAADLIVLGENLFDVDVYDIGKVPVVMTIMNGEIYHQLEKSN